MDEPETRTVLACPECAQEGWYYDIVAHLYRDHRLGISQIVDFSIAAELGAGDPIVGQAFRAKHFQGEAPREIMGRITAAISGEIARRLRVDNLKNPIG